MQISKKTLELIVKTFEASSKDETRIHLNSVRLFNKDGGGVIEATDGHILTRHYVDEIFSEELFIDDEEYVLLDIIGKDRIKKFLTENKFITGFRLEIKDNMLFLTVNNRDGIILPIICRSYPKTDAVIPKGYDDVYEVALNPQLITRLYKAMNGEKRSQKVVFKFNKENNLSPVLVESGINNLGVIMPMKV